MPRTCSVYGCSNGAYRLYQWGLEMCQKHKKIKKNCKCRSPYTLMYFPSERFEPSLRQEWIKQINRGDGWVPKKTSCVCSQHFVPGHTIPTLNLGKVKELPEGCLNGKSPVDHLQAKSVSVQPPTLESSIKSLLPASKEVESKWQVNVLPKPQKTITSPVTPSSSSAGLTPPSSVTKYSQRAVPSAETMTSAVKQIVNLNKDQSVTKVFKVGEKGILSGPTPDVCLTQQPKPIITPPVSRVSSLIPSSPFLPVQFVHNPLIKAEVTHTVKIPSPTLPTSETWKSSKHTVIRDPKMSENKCKQMHNDEQPVHHELNSYVKTPSGSCTESPPPSLPCQSEGRLQTKVDSLLSAVPDRSEGRLQSKSECAVPTSVSAVDSSLLPTKSQPKQFEVRPLYGVLSKQGYQKAPPMSVLMKEKETGKRMFVISSQQKDLKEKEMAGDTEKDSHLPLQPESSSGTPQDPGEQPLPGLHGPLSVSISLSQSSPRLEGEEKQSQVSSQTSNLKRKLSSNKENPVPSQSMSYEKQIRPFLHSLLVPPLCSDQSKMYPFLQTGAQSVSSLPSSAVAIPIQLFAIPCSGLESIQLQSVPTTKSEKSLSSSEGITSTSTRSQMTKKKSEKSLSLSGGITSTSTLSQMTKKKSGKQLFLKTVSAAKHLEKGDISTHLAAKRLKKSETPSPLASKCPKKSETSHFVPKNLKKIEKPNDFFKDEPLASKSSKNKSNDYAKYYPRSGKSKRLTKKALIFSAEHSPSESKIDQKLESHAPLVSLLPSSTVTSFSESRDNPDCESRKLNTFFTSLNLKPKSPDLCKSITYSSKINGGTASRTTSSPSSSPPIPESMCKPDSRSLQMERSASSCLLSSSSFPVSLVRADVAKTPHSLSDQSDVEETLAKALSSFLFRSEMETSEFPCSLSSTFPPSLIGADIEIPHSPSDHSVVEEALVPALPSQSPSPPRTPSPPQPPLHSDHSYVSGHVCKKCSEKDKVIQVLQAELEAARTALTAMKSNHH